MGYKKFYTAILIRLIIIIALSMIVTFLFFEKQSYYICLVLLILLTGAVINIVKYFNNINQWISLFLLGIENEDTTLKAPAKSGNKVIDEVYHGIERLNDLFKQTKLDITLQEQYYRSVINQSATGLFSINERGRVININPAAVKLTDLYDSHHINKLTIIDKALPDFIMHPDQNLHHQSAIFENKYGQKLLFKLSQIITPKETIRLVAVSDITKELDNGEVDAWIKLARTLSHEIMNNITPITTLSQLISKYFIRNDKLIDVKDIEANTISNTVKGLSVIEERSLGLRNFVDNYRKFTKLPAPKLKEVNLSTLIENNLIVATTFSRFSTITLKKNIPEKLICISDEKLLSQVLINLLKNASEALVLENIKNPEITVKLQQTNNISKIEITNNGPAIPPEIREQIFIPFFTTKDEGSGVGLSLSKQIMLKMNGDILLKSGQDKLTTFTVVLN
jgi:two-component system nitrogen regulation sensor histidine kinase NtrY